MTTLVDVARAEEVWDAGRDAGAVQFDDRARRLVRIIDLLPNELAGTVGALAEQATAVMKRTLEGRPAGG